MDDDDAALLASRNRCLPEPLSMPAPHCGPFVAKCSSVVAAVLDEAVNAGMSEDAVAVAVMRRVPITLFRPAF